MWVLLFQFVFCAPLLEKKKKKQSPHSSIFNAVCEWNVHRSVSIKPSCHTPGLLLKHGRIMVEDKI